MLSGNFASTILLTRRPISNPSIDHDQHQRQHRGRQRALNLRRRHREHHEDQAERGGHEQAEQVAAGVHDVADEAAHRALVAGQQVGVLAGHHLLAAIGRVGAAGELLGLALFLAELRAAQLLAPLAGLGGRHRRRRDRAALAGGLAALRRRPALGRRRAWPHGLPRRSTSSTEPDSSGCGVVLLAAQQIHVCQVTSVPRWYPRPACTSCKRGTYSAGMTGSALRVLIAPDCFGDSLTAVAGRRGHRRGLGKRADPTTR